MFKYRYIEISIIQDINRNTILKTNKKYAEEARDEAKGELEQAHTLLTALGVADKTDHEDNYYRKDLKVTTRIALYIAKVQK